MKPMNKLSAPSQLTGSPTGSGTGFPWQTGDPLYAADLNYAIENSSFLVHDSLLTTGGTMTGPLNWTATGATASRAAQDRSAEIIDVKDYGAKGDGSTNDTAAVAAAFAAAAAGGEIWFPAGNYVLASAISQSVTGSVTVRGSGPGVSVISCASNGIAISLATGQNATVRDLSIVSTAAGLANTGLSITAPDQSAQVWLENLRLRGNTGGTTGWQTSINIVGCGVPRIRGITVLTVNGPGTGLSGATCIAISGVSSALNSDNYQISDCQLQGGLYGLYIGNYVEGVLLTNVVILGNDYAVYASNNGNMLEFTNCHINPGVCGVYANAWGFISIVSTFFLRFRATGNWTGIDLEASGQVAICACNFYGNNTGTEIGILVNNAVNTPVTITGNTFIRLGTAAVRLSGTTATAMVVGNNAGSMHAGSVLVNDTTGNASNQAVANSINSVPDIDVSNNNLVVSGNGVQYLGLGGPAHVVGFTWDGNIEGYVDGNHTTTVADTNWVNSNFLKLTSGGTVTGSLLWTSTGTTTPRAAQDRTAEVADVRDFGAMGDGSTNDTAAFTAAAATGNTIWVPPGTYMIAPITISQSMFGAAMGRSILRRATGGSATADVLVTQNATSDAIMRDLTLDGNNGCLYGIWLPSGNTQQTGLRFERLEVTNVGNSSSTASPLPNGIFVQLDQTRPSSKQAIVVADNYIHNVYGCGVSIGGIGCIISHNTIINTGSAGISCDILTDGVISDNTINSPGQVALMTADGITGYGNLNLRVLVSNNTVENSQDHGIHFGGNNIQIVGNKVYNVANYGIILQSSPNSSPTPGANGIIANNEIDTTVGGGGIRCGWFSRVTVTGNTVSNIAAGAPQGVNASSGLTFIYSSDCVASGNIINTTAGYGVYADAALNLLVSSNRYNGTARQAIYDDGGLSTGMTVFGNVITSEGTATAAAFSGAISLRNPVAIGGATTINGAASINGASTLAGSVSLLPPVNWSGYATATIGQTSAGNPGLLFLNTDATAPAIGFYRYASTLYFSYGTAATNTGDIMYISPTQVSMLQPLVASSSARFQTVGFNNTPPVAKPTVTGAKGGNAALGSLLTALASYGLVTDSSTA